MRKTNNAEVLSVFLGSRLMPGRDGKPQKPLTVEEAQKVVDKRKGR